MRAQVLRRANPSRLTGVLWPDASNTRAGLSRAPGRGGGRALAAQPGEGRAGVEVRAGRSSPVVSSGVSLRNNKAGGVDRIARSPEFTNRIRQSIISQSRFQIEH
ncbi:hypothetical protein EDD96_6173 [Streptomyces sp. Ag109_G2-6]|nr:hypothetical protein EDD96_6173 [Streptomyces sp. Ag109_G2-6]